MTIVLLLTALVLLDVFRLFARNTKLSRLGLLVASVARAAIPLTAAIGIGAWQLIASFEGIAATGSGGLIVIAGGAAQVVRSLLTGVIAFAVILVISLILLARHHAIDSGGAGLDGARRRGAALIGMIVVVGALAGAWVTMNWTDKVGIGLLAPLTRPGAIAPSVVTPPPPAFYAAYMKMSGQELAGESERLIPSRMFGLAGCGVLIVLSLATPAMFSGLRASRLVLNLARGGVVTLIAVALWYSTHLRAGAGWLRMVIDR